MKFEKGSKFAGYEIREVLGRGAMGVVYVAWDPNLDREIALKVVSDHLAEDVAFRERFAREAKAAAKVQHPAVVTVYQSGEHEGIPFMAMQLVRGSDLAAILARGGRIDPSRALSILGPIAEGLDAAHAAGVVHRDVKPGNILVPDDGSTPVLVDFGIGRVMEGTRATQTGSWVGTVDYVSPEQVRGGEVNRRSDQYSLACVLFEALSGSPPFEAADSVQAIYAHAHEDPPALPTDLRSSPNLNEALRRGLAKDPDQRFPSCADMIVASQGAFVPPAASVGRTGTIIGAGTSGQAIGPSGTVIGRTTPHDAAISAPPVDNSFNDQKRTRRKRLAWAASILSVAIVAAAGIGLFTNRQAIGIDEGVGIPDPSSQALGDAAPTAAPQQCVKARTMSLNASFALQQVRGGERSAEGTQQLATVALENVRACLSVSPEATGGSSAVDLLTSAISGLKMTFPVGCGRNCRLTGDGAANARSAGETLQDLARPKSFLS